MKKQHKDIREQQQTTDTNATVPIVEEKIDYIKYAAIQLVLGTIALIAMMIVLYMLALDTKHILTILIAYFPYLYIQKQAPQQLHILAWSLYIGIILFAIFFR